MKEFINEPYESGEVLPNGMSKKFVGFSKAYREVFEAYGEDELCEIVGDGEELSYEAAKEGEMYYAKGFLAKGLADGTVAIVGAWLQPNDLTTVRIPSSISTTWHKINDEDEGEEYKAILKVRQIGYYDTEWSTGWQFFVENDETKESIVDSFTTLIISEGVKKIEEKCFGWKAYSLETVILPSTLSSIGAYAFAGLNEIRLLYMKHNGVVTLEPLIGSPQGDKQPFANNIPSYCNAFVPDSAVKSYEESEEWWWQQFVENNNIISDKIILK